MRTNKTIVIGLLVADVASMFFSTAWGMTKAYAQANNVTCSKPAAPGYTYGTLVKRLGCNIT
jgi:hypothetical protein